MKKIYKNEIIILFYFLVSITDNKKEISSSSSHFFSTPREIVKCIWMMGWNERGRTGGNTNMFRSSLVISILNVKLIFLLLALLTRLLFSAVLLLLLSFHPLDGFYWYSTTMVIVATEQRERATVTEKLIRFPLPLCLVLLLDSFLLGARLPSFSPILWISIQISKNIYTSFSDLMFI